MTVARPCSIADALAVIGEKYSLLVLREIFFGVRRFDAITRNTGAPRDIMASRLRRLVEAGVLEKVLYHERPARYEYHLTGMGRELEPILHLLRQWGDRHLASGPPVVVEHACGADLDVAVVCRACGGPATGSGKARFLTPGWTAAGPVD
ncbi:winged helix-turn-helix transcriptional regulator [Sphaerisporangium aureirubrum]|uniref:Winged helix-turn-helix transcriptional regulator n=1 Tax=Sphaerisporangium aureirubrum TaxID=1544736 RepID=A0ABW1NAR9_9ACTN